MLKKPTKEELKMLRQALPEDAYNTLAELTGLKSSSVQQILFKPERINKKNIKVIEQAVILAERNNEKVDGFINRIVAAS